MAVGIEDGRIDPAVGGIAGVEDVVEGCAEDGFLQTLATEGQGVADIDIGSAEGWQGAVNALGVVEVLARDEVGVPCCLYSAPMKVDETGCRPYHARQFLRARYQEGRRYHCRSL